MFCRRNCRLSSASSQVQQYAISEKQSCLAALAFILVVSASISLAQAASAVPVKSPSHASQGRHKLLRPHNSIVPLSHAPSESLQHSQINEVHHTASLPGNENVVATGNGKDKWSTARLSVARYGLAATSLPSQGLALFAGGVGATNIHISGYVMCEFILGSYGI